MVKKYGIYLLILVICLAIGMKTAIDTPRGENTLSIELTSSQTGYTELFYDTGKGFNAEQRISGQLEQKDTRTTLVFVLPYESIKALRWDPVYHEDGVDTTVYSVKMAFYGDYSVTDIVFESIVPQHQIKTFEIGKDSFHFHVASGESDPYLIFTRIPEAPIEPSRVGTILEGLGLSLFAALVLSVIYRLIIWYFDS